MTWFLILCGLFGLVMGLRGGSSQANTWEETDAEHYYDGGDFDCDCDYDFDFGGDFE